MTVRTALTYPEFDPAIPVIGADYARNWWVACRVGAAVQWVQEYETLDELLREASESTLIAVDVPVQLEDEWRSCDREALRLLGDQRSTHFVAPPRPVFEAKSSLEANQVEAHLTGEPLPQQVVFGDRWIKQVARITDRRPIFEVHPELSFAAMAGEPVAYPKTTWNGQMRRRQLLAAEGLEIPDRLLRVVKSAPDDVLDAVAVAWSARRIAAGEAERIPAVGDGAAIWR